MRTANVDPSEVPYSSGTHTYSSSNLPHRVLDNLFKNKIYESSHISPRPSTTMILDSVYCWTRDCIVRVTVPGCAAALNIFVLVSTCMLFYYPSHYGLRERDFAAVELYLDHTSKLCTPIP